MNEAMNKGVHEIYQNFTFRPRKKRFDLVERVTGPAGRIDKDQGERTANIALYVTDGFLKVPAIGLYLKSISRLVITRNCRLELCEGLRIVFREEAADRTAYAGALHMLPLSVKQNGDCNHERRVTKVLGCCLPRSRKTVDVGNVLKGENFKRERLKVTF